MTVASAWQVRCVRVRQRGACLLSLGAWSDCWFVAGARRERVAAHRLLLAMASPVFEAMFFGPLAERGDSIDIPDVETDTFKALLKYLYTDNVEISSCEAAYALYYAAEKYMLPRLKSKSIAYLFRKLSPQNAGCTYEFAELTDENKLKEKCLEMIRTNTLKMLKHRSFGELQLDTVVKIFSLEPLNITSELDLFEAAKDYVAVQSKKVAMEEEKVKTNEAANNHIVNDETEKTDDNRTKNDKNADGEVETKDAVNNGTNGNGIDNNCVNDEPEDNSAATNGTLNGETDNNNAEANNNGAKETSCLVAETHKVDGSTDYNGAEYNDNLNGKIYKDCAKENESENIGADGNILVSCIEAKTNEVKNDSADVKDKNTRVSIRNAIEKIRFLTLDHRQFAKYDFSALLSLSETFAIALNIMARDTVTEMPSGFSTSRKPRHQLTEMEDDNRTEAIFRTSVDDLKNLTKHWSADVNICNVPWQLLVETTNEVAGDKFLSVYLFCNRKDKTTWSCEAEWEFRLLSNRMDTEPYCVQDSYKFMFV